MSDPSEQAKSIFLEAIEQAPAQWPAFLEQACAGDAGLRIAVEKLLRAQAEIGSFHEQPRPPVAATVDEPVSERPGAVIGAYKLLEQIGEGGFGVVFMAEQHHPVRRKVALKVLKPGMDTRQVVARFEAERQALAIMDHPNIAKVFDGGATSSGRPYFVMELVKGVPITHFCDDNHLTPRQRLELFMPVCQAIQHAHQKGIIHRDLKPSNVLVTMHDTTPVVKIIDFGVAKALGQELTDKTLYTGFAQMIGTPLYMSPEQAGQSGLDVDTRSDIYSLGVLLYELLTGTTPFDKARFRTAAYDEIRRIIREEEPPKPSTRLSELGRSGSPSRTDSAEGPARQAGPTSSLASISALRHTEPAKLTKLVRGELDWIVMKALEKDRNRRYETANGFAMDVQRYLADEPVQACPPSASYRLRKFLRRNKGPVLAVVVVVLALVGGIIGTTWGMLRATDAEADAVAEATQKEEQRAKAVTEGERATRAERDARHRLYQAKLAEAQARRWSGQAGRRFEGLKALTEAARLARELELGAEVFLTLRNEAIACMALVDLRLDHKWEGYPSGSGHTGIAFDATMERYARVDGNGDITVRGLADNREAVRITDIGAPASPGRRPDWRMTLCFSRDGRFVAAAGDHIFAVPMQVWDLSGPKSVLKGAHGAVRFKHTLDFSQDSRLLVAGRLDGSVSLYDVLAAKQLKGFSLAEPVRGVRFHPHMDRLAVCSGSQVHVLDLDGRPLIAPLSHPGITRAVSWSADGQRLATACDGGQAYIWDAASGKQQMTCKGGFVAFSNRGDLLASSFGETTKLWDAWTGKELLSADGLAGEFSRDDRWLGLGVFGPDVGRWEVATGGEYRPLYGHPREAAVSSLAISPDGRVLASAASDGVRLWDLACGKVVATVPTGKTDSVIFDVSGRFFVSSGAAGVYRWPIRLGTAAAPRLQLGPPEPILPPFISGDHPASLSADGRTLGVHSGPGGLVILDPERPNDKPRSVNPVYSFGISPDGKWVATNVGDAYESKLWDAQTAKWVRDFPGMRTAQVTFSPDNRWLVFRTAQEYLFYHVDSWQPGPRVRRDYAGYNAGPLAFTRDGSMAAIAYSARALKLIDPESGREFATLTTPAPEELLSLCFTPDGSQLAAGTRNGVVQLWDLRWIRQQLRDMGLDWKPPADLPRKADDPKPLQVEVDLGNLRDREKYSIIIGLCPFHPEAYYQRGIAHARYQQWQQAFDDFNMTLTLKPDHALASYQRGLIHARNRRPKAAAEDFSRTIKLQPEHGDAYQQRGQAYAAFNQWDKAVPDYSKAIELDPKDWERWQGRAKAYFHSARWQQASADYSKVIELKPDHVGAWNERGIAHFRLGQWDRAVKDHTKAIELKPDDPVLRLNRGLAHAKLRHWDKAIADYSKVIEMKPDHVDAWNERAIAHGRLDQWDRAVKDSTKALQLAPDDPILCFNLGFAKSLLGGALLGRKKYADAEPLLLEGYEGMKQREPKIRGKVLLSEALERLVRLYDATGQKEKAAQWRPKLQAAKRVDELWQDLLTGQQARHRFIETRQEGSLTAAKQKQTHPLEMKAGTTYVLDMESKAFDTFLILEDKNGSQVAQNDDISHSNLNSRLIHTAQTTASYRVIATCYRPGATGPYVLRIRELVDVNGRKTEADKAFQEMIAQQDRLEAELVAHPERRPALAQAQFVLGMKLKSAGRNKEAEALLRRALAQFERLTTDFPSTVEYWKSLASCQFRLGQTLQQTGRPTEAEAPFRAALAVCKRLADKSPTDGDAIDRLGSEHFRLAGLLAQLRRPQEAEQTYGQAARLYERAAELGPRANDARFAAAASRNNRAGQLLTLGRSAEAVAEYRASLRVCEALPQDVQNSAKYKVSVAWTCNALAWLLATCADAQLRDPTRALALAKRAVQLDPKNGFYWQTLGYAEYRAGNWKAAIAALEKVKELGSPGDSLEWFPLAMAHWQLGNKDDARKWYDRAVQWMDKSQPHHAELRRFRSEAGELLGVKEKKD